MEKIVLTGGPSGGKSTAIDYIGRTGLLLGSAPEVATMLLGGGFPAPDDLHPWSYEWQRSLQQAIGTTQLALEAVMDERSATDELYGTVYDRGLADGAAYLHGGIGELSELTGLAAQEITGRYGLVIHLVSSAKQARGYQKHTNQHRFEEAAEAIRLDDKIIEAWEGHPNRKIIDIEDAPDRNRQVLHEIHHYLYK